MRGILMLAHNLASIPAHSALANRLKANSYSFSSVFFPRIVLRPRVDPIASPVLMNSGTRTSSPFSNTASFVMRKPPPPSVPAGRSLSLSATRSPESPPWPARRHEPAAVFRSLDLNSDCVPSRDESNSNSSKSVETISTTFAFFRVQVRNWWYAESTGSIGSRSSACDPPGAVPHVPQGDVNRRLLLARVVFFESVTS